jgi:hypothetical protein
LDDHLKLRAERGRPPLQKSRTHWQRHRRRRGLLFSRGVGATLIPVGFKNLSPMRLGP